MEYIKRSIFAFCRMLLSFLAIPLLAGLESKEEIAMIGAIYVNFDQMNESVNNIINYPYASPEYLLQQVYIVKNCVERYTGKKYDMKSMILYANDKIRACGGVEILKKQLNSIIDFIDRKKHYFEFNYAYNESLDYNSEIVNIGL